MIGPVAGKLHTGRSRNDQVATDTKLWLKDAAKELDSTLAAIIMVCNTKNTPTFLYINFLSEWLSELKRKSKFSCQVIRTFRKLSLLGGVIGFSGKKILFLYVYNFHEKHFNCSHAWALNQDRERLAQLVERTMAKCPLGSGALAGTPLGLDRTKVALALGFKEASENSMHAVADRDFVGI